MRGQEDVGLVVGGFEGEDVPGVGGDYPSTSLRTGYGGEEVDLGAGDPAYKLRKKSHFHRIV